MEEKLARRPLTRALPWACRGGTTLVPSMDHVPGSPLGRGTPVGHGAPSARLAAECPKPADEGPSVLQGFFDGLLGAVGLAPLVAGFALVYAPTRIFHIAAGAIYALAPYGALAFARLGLPAPACFACAVALGSLVSVLLECCNHWPLERRRSSGLGHFVASLGAATVIVQLLVLCWGTDPMTLRSSAHRVIALGPVHVSTGQLVTAIVGVLSVAVLYSWLPCTSAGMHLRALASNPSEAAVRGLNTRVTRVSAFALSGALCSVAGLVRAWDFGFDPYSGTSPTLLAIVAVALGGRYSFWAPLGGILLVGLARGVAVTVLSAQWQDAAAFLLLAAILVARPGGMIAAATRAGGRL